MDLVRTRTLIFIAVATVVAAGVLAARTAFAQSSSAPPRQTATSHTITVVADGQASVAPDEAVVTLGVQTRAPTAQDAMSKNATLMNAVIKAVEDQGVAAGDIQSSGISLWYDKEGDAYNASHQITVTVRSITKTGPVLDAAVAAGANNSWGVTFSLKDPTAAQAEALKQAVARARTHANAIASALGVSIAGVQLASEPSYQQTPIVYGAGGVVQPAPVAPTPVQPGQLTVTANVTVAYTFS